MTWSPTALPLTRTEDYSPIRSCCQSYTQVLVCSQSKPDVNTLLHCRRYRLCLRAPSYAGVTK